MSSCHSALVVLNETAKHSSSERIGNRRSDHGEISQSRIIEMVDNLLSAAQDQGLSLEIQGEFL